MARKRSRRATRWSTRLLDALLAVLVAPAALLLKSVRRMGLHRLVLCRRVLLGIGVLPVRRHYYEPLTDRRYLRHALEDERPLPGIDWNEGGQLAALAALRFEGELEPLLARARQDPAGFRMDNGQFEAGDAEFLYQIIRARKPAAVVEIGSGHSSLLAQQALLRNAAEGAPGRQVCIEPYRAPWLERAGITTVRKKVEEVDRALFRELGEGDLLFIDSSHVIRPQGDVLAEYLEILPSLAAGVIVHVHDIFSPRDYPRGWVLGELKLWNEQYLLEAFLAHNRAWKIVGALNFLKHRHYEALARVCPYLSPEREPGSFYIEKIE
ncbi:MAG: class I SAM-dependent methyltransferase [Steroidobacteraceae bacterium]